MTDALGREVNLEILKVGFVCNDSKGGFALLHENHVILLYRFPPSAVCATGPILAAKSLAHKTPLLFKRPIQTILLDQVFVYT